MGGEGCGGRGRFLQSRWSGSGSPCRCEQLASAGEIVHGPIWPPKGVLGHLNEESLVDFFIYNPMGEIIFRLAFGGNGTLKFKGGS